MKQLIRFDWAIKKLLRNKANFDILEGFLSELLKKDLKIKQILESESNKEQKDDKFNRVDLLVELNKKELVIIEIQNTRELDYFQRMLYGTAKVLTEHIDTGQKYSVLKKVISVNIVYFDLGQGDDYIYHGKTNFIGVHQKDQLELSEAQKRSLNLKSIDAIYPEYYVIKVNQFDNVAKDTLDEWIYFLKKAEIKPHFKAKGLLKAKETLDVMKLSEKEQKAYRGFLETLRDDDSYAETIQADLELSIRENTLELARRSILAGLSDEIIAQITQLSIDEIQELRTTAAQN